MGELGELLRTARERRGLSLREAEEATRIRLKFLQGLESDDYSAMPAPVYTRGFLRNYARFLGLDADDLVDRYDRLAAALPARSVRRGRREPSVSARAWLGPDTRTSVVAVLLILVVGGLAYFFRQYSAFVATSGGGAIAAATSTPPLAPTPSLAAVPTTAPPLAVLPPPTPTAVPTSRPTAAPTAVPRAVPTVAPTAAPTAPPQPTATATPQAGVALTATVSAPAWVRVIVDGTMIFEGTIQAGSQRNWDGKHSVTLRVGNAGGVRIAVNGKDQGVLGQSGQVIQRTWTAAAATTSAGNGAVKTG